jgi:hypothetical protein
MVSVQIESKSNESENVAVYVVTLQAVPSPIEIEKTLPEKVTEILLALYPNPDSPFAVEVELDGLNEKRQSMSLELRIKDGQDLTDETLIDRIRHVADSLSGVN